MHRLVKTSGKGIDAKAPNHWLWLRNRAITADGATVTMANSPANQASHPQLSSQAHGCGLPILRAALLFTLSTGVVLDMAMGRYKGKLTHEVSLFRQIDPIIEETDVFLADRAYPGSFERARVVQQVLRWSLASRTSTTSSKNIMQMEHLRCKKPHRDPRILGCLQLNLRRDG